MIEYLSLGAIHVRSINLWAHVGVLEEERLLGQEFLLDFSLWLDVRKTVEKDKIEDSADYSIAIKGLQQLAFEISCFTIETFSEQILDFLETIYGPVPVKICLRKCNPPIKGFSGNVEIERFRYMESLKGYVKI
tara:strand:- start:626 stop:1027 length:402 start_codon:yes stop_codon:yes gene_type:complete